ncbi:MAG TPA: GTPase domain-containing protein [Myxococcales bacterium LLY-WYZ-16_1]|nr:GTPase domain-containing protein [Myxococcales bacterium LLY-WYZ-16_1]
MPTYNYKSRELIAKVVFYGPGRCGKTTNLQQIHAKMRPETRSELLSVATETDRTIYFDLLPLNLGTISGMKFMVRLFTVPGQVYYSETRRLVLKGADGVVFVADSQNHMLDENRQSLQDLRQNLAANGLDFDSIPLVMQWNKRDLPQLVSEAELDATLNVRGVKAIPAVAARGTGVLETLRSVTLSVFNHIKAGGKAAPGPRSTASAPVSSSAPIPASAPAHGVAPAPSVGSVQPGAWSQSASARASAPAAPPGPAAPAPAGPPQAAASTPAAAAAESAPAAPGLRPDGPQPMRVDVSMVMEEFKSLAVMQSQLSERMSQLETEMQRLSRENQDIREMLTRRSGTG